MIGRLNDSAGYRVGDLSEDGNIKRSCNIQGGATGADSNAPTGTRFTTNGHPLYLIFRLSHLLGGLGPPLAQFLSLQLCIMTTLLRNMNSVIFMFTMFCDLVTVINKNSN